MQSIIILAQLFAVFYFSLLFEGLHDKLYGMRLKSTSDAKKDIDEFYKKSPIATWFNNDVAKEQKPYMYNEDSLLEIIGKVHQKGTKAIKFMSLIGFLLCMFFISYTAYIELSETQLQHCPIGLFILTVHPTITLPGLLCFLYYKYYYIPRSECAHDDIKQKLTEKTGVLENCINRIISTTLPVGNNMQITDALASIDNTEFIKLFLKEYSNGHQINAATITAQKLFEKEVNKIISDYRKVTSNNNPFRLCL